MAARMVIEGVESRRAPLRLTDEQREIVARVEAGDSLKVEALAGTGKTSTFEAIGRAIPTRGMLYIAFNKSVQEEAQQRMPGNVESRTAHSLAYASVGKKFGERVVRNIFALKRGLLPVLETEGRKAGKPGKGYVVPVLDAIGEFQMTADATIEGKHLADGVTDPDWALTLTRAAWAAMVDPDGKTPITDSTYLKLWQLSRPKLRRDVILLDEAQDTDPCLLDVFMRQQTQRVVVGDEHQAIYEWRGAINAMRAMGFPSLPLTQSWRFGPTIAEYANRVLAAKRAKLRVRGRTDGDDLVCVEHERCPDVVLARTNVGLVGEALILADSGKTIAVVGGLAQLVRQIEAAYELYRTNRTGHPAFGVFDSWAELVEASETQQGQSYRPFVQLIQSHRNSIPAVCSRLSSAERPEGQADVLLCTAHRFKGREGEHVRLSGDFRPFVEERDCRVTLDEPEANLDYVAITRARSVLNLADFAPAFADSCRLAALVEWPEVPEAAPVIVADTTPTLPLDVPKPLLPLSETEDRINATELRLRKGSDWLDAENDWLTRHRHEPLTVEYAHRRGEYERQQARWTAMLEELSALYARCPHTHRELVRLVGEDGTSYPYQRCGCCRVNVDGNVYLADDDHRLEGVRVASLPKVDDYMTPERSARLASANAAGQKGDAA